MKEVKAKLDSGGFAAHLFSNTVPGNGVDVNFGEILKYSEPCMVAELLKEFIRDLPSPLIPPRVLAEMQEALSMSLVFHSFLYSY